MNILITSISRKVSLVESFKKALMKEGGGKVFAADMSPYAAGLYMADDYILVPKSDDPDFVHILLKICQRKKIGLLIPTRDEELPFFAEHKEKFLQIGTVVMIPSPKTVSICQDKCRFHEFCLANGFRAAIKLKFENTCDMRYPVFARPRVGKGSKGAARINSHDELDLYLRHTPDAIIQEFVEAPEFTIDLFADLKGNVLSAVPRQRIITFGGESFVTRTRKNHLIINESVRLSKTLDLVGHNTIQCFLDKDEVKLIEVNPRFGGAAHLSFAAGAPSPLFLVQLLKGKKIDTMLNKFKDNYVMLRYTQDIFITEEKLGKASF